MADFAQNNIAVDPIKSLQRKLGEGFPGVASTDGVAWRKWIDSQRKLQEQVMRDKRLHWSRHRHFRNSHQWISTRDGRTWREPQADANDVRPVLNLIGPALDFRLGILSEQRPGFRHEPLAGGVAAREAAEAQQAVAEYYFYTLRLWLVYLDAWYNAQTDGVSFIHVYRDESAGPSREDIDLIPETDERYAGLVAQGYTVNEQGLVELPYQDEGVVAPPDVQARILYEGDIACRVLLAHEVIFDPEARTVNGPMDKARWAIVRRVRDVAQARLETGDSKLEAEGQSTTQSDMHDMTMDRSAGWQRGLPPFPTKRYKVTDGVPEYLVWIAPDINEPELQQGIWLRIIGNTIVDRGGELPGGVIPLARVTDGSADPDIFPRPVMSDWIGDQVAINALLSLLLKHARWFSGGRVLAMKNTLLEETYSNIVGSLVEYQGAKPDVFQPVSAGQDAWKLLDWLVKKLEDKTAHNDIARGQLTGSGGASASDISGRAVLATRELFERAFGPVVRAAAEGATETAHLIIRYAQWMFDTPRLIPAASGRGDLAKKIDSSKLGDKPMVYADPETMMPLPRALRQQTLEDQLDKGRISLPTYQKRSPYADVRDLHMGDSEQWERAQWINTQIEEQWEAIAAMEPQERYMAGGNGIPVLWQDVQAVAPQAPQGTAQQQLAIPTMFKTVHKDALLEIVLNERRPWGMRQVAIERWGIYDQLERAMNDPTGATPVPLEVTGTPPDKILGMMPTPAGAVSAQPPAPAGPTGEGAPPAPGTLVSPTPTNAPMVTEAGKQPRPELTDAERVL